MKHCEYCGKEFKKNCNSQKFCSAKCRRKNSYEKNKDYYKKYREEHKEQYKEWQLNWEQENKGKRSKRHREQHIERKYGITLKQYNQILTKQNHRCAICGTKMKERYFCVDHKHLNGVIRGLLCNNCNQGLGRFKDNSLILAKAIKYLTKGEK